MINEEWLNTVFFGNSIHAYLWFAGIILAGLIFRKILSKLCSRFLFKFLKKYASGVGVDKFVELLQKPIGIFILLITLYIAFDKLSFPTEWNFADSSRFGIRMVLLHSYKILIILSFTWIILRSIDFTGDIFLYKASLTESRSDDQVVPFARDFIKVFIVIFSLFFILGAVFNMNIASLVAGLGIGGLAIALAAKESLENLFGSFTIFLDKPFVAGDLIKIGNITGNVESIGFRSTRIRTLEKTYVSVPNKKMVEAELENLTLRTFKRVLFKIGLIYQTSPEQLKKIVEDIISIMKKHPLISDDYEVCFYEFSESSMNIHVLYYISSNDGFVYLKIREEINFKILKIIGDNGGVFAYPSMTNYIQYTDSAKAQDEK